MDIQSMRIGVVGGLLLLSGCSITATMVPVEGPMSQQDAPPVIDMKVDGVDGNSGDISGTLPGGEQCEGRWASAAGSGVTLFSESLLSTYGSTYSSGFAVSPGQGQNPGQAILTCAGGRTIQLEFVTGAGTASGFGIGKDNRGNIYKLVF